jgi:hypothetical protein
MLVVEIEEDLLDRIYGVIKIKINLYYLIIILDRDNHKNIKLNNFMLLIVENQLHKYFLKLINQKLILMKYNHLH